MADTCRYEFPTGRRCDMRRAPAAQGLWAARGYCAVHARMLEEGNCICSALWSCRRQAEHPDDMDEIRELCGYCQARAAFTAGTRGP